MQHIESPDCEGVNARAESDTVFMWPSVYGDVILSKKPHLNRRIQKIERDVDNVTTLAR
jgi:hypothetical protein